MKEKEADGSADDCGHEHKLNYEVDEILHPATMVDLSISCKKLVNLDTFSETDPYCIVYIREDEKSSWKTIGQTETIMNNLNPDFSTQISVSYYFEKRQHIKFEVWNFDTEGKSELVGCLETEMGKIMAGKSAFKGDLDLPDGSSKKRGKIFVRATSEGDCNDEIHAEISAKLVSIKPFFSCGY